MISREDPEEPKNLSRNPKFVSEVVEEAVASQPGKKKKIASERPLLLVILKSSPIVILAISCVIAVFVDPLFFYLPIIDEKNKCIGMDTQLRNVVLILRNLTDIGFIVHSIHKIRQAVWKTRKDLDNLPKTKRKPNRDERSKFAKALARNLSWHSIIIDFFAVLPIPQVVILAFRSSRYLDQRKIPNFFLLAQYLLRVYRIRHSSKKLKHKTGMWAKGLFYFLLYLLASHPLETQKSLKYFLCRQTLVKVPKLENLKSKALALVLAYLKPVVFQDNIIFQIGVPLDRILFITEGLIWTYEAVATSNTNSCTSQDGNEKTGFSFLHKGGFYGDDQLLSWAIASQKNDLCFANLPISNENVKCHGKVEGFVLMAKDLKTVVSSEHWGFHDSVEREEAARQTISRAVRRFKDRKRKRSLWGCCLCNKIKALFHCCDCAQPNGLRQQHSNV